MRKVTEVKRKKEVYFIPINEFKKGEWLDLIPDSEMVEITYKKFYLTISDCKIKSREGDKHVRREGIREVE